MKDKTLKEALAIKELVYERSGEDLSVAGVARIAISEMLHHELTLREERIRERV
jgi:hypothetical protein